MATTNAKWFIYAGIMLICLSLSGCSLFSAQAKPDQQTKSDGQELQYLEKAKRPPPVYFDLEGQIEDLFKALNTLDFAKAQQAYQNVQATWEAAKRESGTMKGVKETDEALTSLGSALSAEKGPESIASLNKFTYSLNQLLMNYKLSPLSDIVNFATISRNVAWAVGESDFKKAKVRSEELKKTWASAKVNLEQPGILGEVTKAHDSVSKIEGSVSAENQMAAEDQLKKFDESLTKIRNFYKNKNTSFMP